MTRALHSCIWPCIWLVAACGPALAEDEGQILLDSWPWWGHVAITVLGMFWAVKLASKAFDRPLPLADIPTSPRCMTSPHLYQFGSWVFVTFACGFFLLLVYEHREVVITAKVFEDWVPKYVLDAISNEAAPYLAIVAGMGLIYLYFLKKETQWNVLLMMRDAIQGWMSVPQLANRIVGQIQSSLQVPTAAIEELIGSGGRLDGQDFRKGRNTPDRQWAECCYMKWWLTQRQETGGDAIFFAQEALGFNELVSDFEKLSRDVEQLRAHDGVVVVAEALSQMIKTQHNRFSRLVACYLIYHNESRTDIYAEASDFGIKLSETAPENPVRYWIVYAIALMAAVYVGVIFSAVLYDLLHTGKVILAQDPGRAVAWVMYSLSNYGLAIIAILLLRFIIASKFGSNPSHLVIYCWTFLVALVVGPLGLTIAVHNFGQPALAAMPLDGLYFKMLQWGVGPALVCVYISYYLDRQTYPDLPNINQSPSTIGWRLLNCFGFAAMNLFLLLSPLLSPTAQPNAVWDSSKLHFVATGTTFSIAFGLALAAQFALRRSTQAAAENHIATPPASPTAAAVAR